MSDGCIAHPARSYPISEQHCPKRAYTAENLVVPRDDLALTLHESWIGPITPIVNGSFEGLSC